VLCVNRAEHNEYHWLRELVEAMEEELEEELQETKREQQNEVRHSQGWWTMETWQRISPP